MLRRAFLYLEDHSDELPSCWKFGVLAARDDHLRQNYSI
jgi:hypothetical protein